MKFVSILAALSLLTSFAHAGLGFYPTRYQVQTPQYRARVAQGTSLKYYGGPVISNPRVITVFWGEGVDATIQKEIGGMYAAAVNSNHMEWLNQYATFGKAVDGRQGTNQSIGRGTYGGDFKIVPSNLKKSLDDLEVRAEIEHQVTMHVLPPADINTLYMIHFPAGVSITIEGQKSCSSFCAYHEGYMSKTMGPIFYGIMPDLNSGACKFSCGFAQNPFDSATQVSSHEMVEAITDPFPTPGNQPAFPQAWNTTDGQEIADLCASAGPALLRAGQKSYKLSQEWNNQTNSCFAGPFESK